MPTSVREYGKALVPLESKDLKYLLQFVRASGESDEGRVLEALTPTGQAGIYEVRAGPFVGRLGLPSGEWIDFQSRFEFEDLIELIRRSGRLPVLRSALEVEARMSPFLIELLAQAFIREVNKLIGRGLAKAYETRLFTSPPYPGRLDVSYHLSRQAARPDRLSTRARRITVDIPINQALGLALDALIRVPLPFAISAGIARLIPVFAQIKRTRMAPEAIASLPLTALTYRYKQALALAELILRGQSLAPRGEGQAGASILFYMPKVWESTVSEWVRSMWPSRFRIESTYAFGLTDRREMQAEADIVVFDNENLVALYDAKYKWPDKAPTAGDVYQMVTYCHRLHLGEATLVYPVETQERSISVRGKYVRVIGLRPLISPERAPSGLGKSA